MAKKVLVGIVTYDKMDYCLSRLVDALKNQEFQDFEVLFVDNSEENYEKKIGQMGFRVIKDSRKDARISNIISGRNIIREEFLKGDYEYLFFLDSDVIIPSNAIAKLLSAKKPIVSGIYLVAKNINGKPRAFPCIYRQVGDGKSQQIMLKEVIGDNLIEISMAGLGCCLIHRDVIKDIMFRNATESKTGGEDSAFFVDARSKGFIAYADTSVKCFHMAYPENDPRHNFHKFETHIKIVPKTSLSYSHSLNIEGFELK